MNARPMILLWAIFAISLLLPVGRVKADPIPDQAYIQGLQGHKQSLSLSCESRSAVDWAAYWEVKIGEKRFLAKLPRSKNPDKGFVGNPNDPWGNVPPASYGVHAQPVAELLREYGLSAEARRDLAWEDLQKEIAAGRPVIVWVIGQMWEGKPVQYTSPDRHKTVVASYEHTMILIGYEPGKVYVVDAYTGGTQSYPLRSFLRSWKTLGRMAITGGGPYPAVSPVITQDPPVKLYSSLYLPVVLNQDATEQPVQEISRVKKTYKVRRGDNLSDVARRFGVNWRVLAKHNGLEYPYVIYSGQVLKIP